MGRERGRREDGRKRTYPTPLSRVKRLAKAFKTRKEDVLCSDARYSQRAVLLLKPRGVRGSVREEIEQNDSPRDRDGTQDVCRMESVLERRETRRRTKDELPTRYGLGFRHPRDTCRHQRANHPSPPDGAVPNRLTKRCFCTCVPEASH